MLNVAEELQTQNRPNLLLKMLGEILEEMPGEMPGEMGTTQQEEQ